MMILHTYKKTTPFYPIKYGALYNWWALTDARNIANTGWHVPTVDEYQVTLLAYLGTYTVAGGKMKETGFTYWDSPNTGATNEVGFNGRGSGYIQSSGGFSGMLSKLWLGTITQYATSYYLINLSNDKESVGINAINSKQLGSSIRLVKNSTTLSDGETGTYTGNDGKLYRTICIGTQEWLADNLFETKYRNGDWITGYNGGVYTPMSDASWAALTTEAMCIYGNNISNA